MEVLSNLLYGFTVAVTPMNLVFVFIGVVAGLIIGALPGLGPTAGLAVLLPLTFGADPVSGIIMLAGIYYGAMFGGAITAILINIPGAPSAVMTTLDGYPLAQQGRAGQAIGMSAFASFIGGTIGLILFMFLSPLLAKAALTFGPPEYFALMILGLTTLAAMTGDSQTKGYISALIGLFLASIGTDLVSGVPRFSFGSPYLFSGMSFIPVAMGVFGIAELLSKDNSISDYEMLKQAKIKFKNLFPSKRDWFDSKGALVQGSLVGFFIGMLPGAGATIASFISYGIAKKSSKRPELFGNGAIEGVAAPESANNAASTGAFVPLLSLGVPGSASTAILLGALMMFGLTPGPMLFQQHPDFVWGLIASMYVGNIVLLAVVLLTIPLFVKILQVEGSIMNSIVIAFILVGAYSLGNSMFYVYLTLGFGLLGYFMKKINIPGAPMVLGLVLGGLLERSLRQSLIMSRGSMTIFFTRPISATILVICLIYLVYPAIKKQMAKKKNMAA